MDWEINVKEISTKFDWSFADLCNSNTCGRCGLSIKNKEWEEIQYNIDGDTTRVCLSCYKEVTGETPQ